MKYPYCDKLELRHNPRLELTISDCLEYEDRDFSHHDFYTQIMLKKHYLENIISIELTTTLFWSEIKRVLNENEQTHN